MHRHAAFPGRGAKRKALAEPENAQREHGPNETFGDIEQQQLGQRRLGGRTRQIGLSLIGRIQDQRGLAGQGNAEDQPDAQDRRRADPESPWLAPLDHGASNISREPGCSNAWVAFDSRRFSTYGCAVPLESSPLEACVMTVQILLGLMGTLCVVAVYFWLVRSKGPESPQ